MAALKSSDVSAFLKSPNPAIECVLVFGGDAGLVGETAKAIAHRFSESSAPTGDIVRIEDSDLEGDADRLIVELKTMQMFGGPKIVRTTASRRITATSLKPLLDGGLTGRLIVEAGALKADDALRALFEKSPKAIAVACYADTARDLEAVVREVMTAAKLNLTANAKQLLLSRLGADRALSRAEIEKLALYAHGRDTIDVDDVEAIVGDAAEQTTEQIVASSAIGQTAQAVTEFDRAVAAGENPQVIIAAIQRHFHRLHRVRAGLDAGRSFDDATRGLRPPLFYKQKPTMEAQCRLWTTDRLSDARGRIGRALKAARLTNALESVIAERLLVEISALAKAGAGKRG